MDTQDVAYQKPESHITDFIEEQNNCCICGSQLELRHQINHYNLTVCEEARCLACGIRNRVRNYTVQ